MMRGLWRAVWYLLAYQLIGWVLVSVVLTAAVGAACLCITIAGIPLLITAAAVIHGCANVERARLRSVLGVPVEGRYRVAAEPGLLARARACWIDPATWRDLGYLAGMFLPLVILGGLVLTLWGTCLAGMTLPLYYWAFPHGAQILYIPHVVDWHVRTLPEALLAAVGCAVGFVAFSWLTIRTARLHATVAQALLRPPLDPLAPAKDMLLRPGPLPALQPSERLVVPGHRD
jgi:putative sensor protein